ncbi:GNAT family N-acetyltransferase [Streptomyces beijiangensis]|uniref:GNAT family N-acetyltransferase n=1 Tax=Streptomyces beijiangensis TaxID=163361 RepID=A0A939F9D2_9ACTN|nr:GNAT family N-acetyltransferase [Streptomyces beijiangensis]MBO0512880.1 GNAT family N-acetyltransferase [Streptomyces beijiangensis]
MSAQLTFRMADSRADADALVELFDGAARWMGKTGIDQWKSGDKSAEHFLLRMKEGEVWLAETGAGRIAGAYELWWDDVEAWGVQPPVAGYVHRLMVDREAASPGTGGVLLAHAERRISDVGRPLVRLDCVTSNPRLRTYYESAGYRVVGEFTGKARRDGLVYGVTLLEKEAVPG